MDKLTDCDLREIFTVIALWRLAPQATLGQATAAALAKDAVLVAKVAVEELNRLKTP